MTAEPIDNETSLVGASYAVGLSKTRMSRQTKMIGVLFILLVIPMLGQNGFNA